MIKWAILLVLVGIPIVFLSLTDFEEKQLKSGSELEKSSIIEVGQEFINQASPLENSSEERILGTFREITEEELLLIFRLPNLDRNEKIMNMGVRISTQYNQASFDYSSGRITDTEYYKILFNLRENYEAYLTFSDSYVGEGDILIQKKSMNQELKKINEELTILKNSEKFEIPKYLSENEKYKKFLPSMFTP